MAQEIEAKYRVADPAAFRERLAACGAQPGARVFEANRLFDTADRKLRAADCGLRVRTCRSLDDAQHTSATLTYKGPRAAGEMKVREEVETAVTDPSAVATILERLGFNEVIFYEKRRESWRVDECEVCLDELPRLGWFIEIEGPSAPAVTSACDKLKLSGQTALSKTYVEMAAEHGAPRGANTVGIEFEL
jgi:adenylate cyclase class 2